MLPVQRRAWHAAEPMHARVQTGKSYGREVPRQRASPRRTSRTGWGGMASRTAAPTVPNGAEGHLRQARKNRGATEKPERKYKNGKYLGW